MMLSFDPFPILSTTRLRLRQVAESDAPEIFFLRSDSRMMQYLDRAPATSITEALAHIQQVREIVEKGEGVYWAIELNDHPGLIGTIGFWRLQKAHYRAEIGYALHPDQQGKGLMQEALQEVLAFGFRTMGLHSVEANVNPNNTHSIRLLEKAGFVREGFFRENYYYNGQFLDSAIYSLVKPK